MSQQGLPRCFIASPLFNDPQRAQVHALLAATEGAGWPSYQCLRDGIVVEGKRDKKVLRDAFLQDIDEIKRSQLLVVNLDYLQGPNQSLRVVETKGEGPFHDIKSGPLYLPDSGSVWEMACGYTLNKVIVTICTVTERVNLMMTQSADFHVRSLLELKTLATLLYREYMESDDLRLSVNGIKDQRNKGTLVDAKWVDALAKFTPPSEVF